VTTAVNPAALRGMLDDGGELALVDVREELIFSQGHLLLARSAPLSRLELNFGRLVPRRATRIVLCDDNDGRAEWAAVVLSRNGYHDLHILDGGVRAWATAGFEIFTGVNVPSKAFGEFIEHQDGTPSISADELARLLRDNADLVVVDSRPFDEYRLVSIPGATNVPGAELVLRAREIAPSADTLVVVNCAGRTRSIIGAQSLINARLPNKVVALRNGTMGWNLAGLTCDSGKNRRAPKVSAQQLDWAKRAARSVAQACGVESITRAQLDAWRGDPARTLYVFDVRDPAEYEAGHLAAAISAPGGQLVQATDQYIGTLNARVVLMDDLEVRAAMTGSWLRQMGFAEVYVLAEAGRETGWPDIAVLKGDDCPQAAIDCGSLGELLSRNAATVVDLSLSRNYLAGHIPGAWFAIRSRLAPALKKISPAGALVLTSEDGALAELAVNEAANATDQPVHFLNCGNAAWRAAGRPLSTESKMADEAVDQWRKPYERSGDAKAAMADYLAWEMDLLPRIKRDGALCFERFRPRLPQEAR
jgi:rhodanese-related sulfurtransferase